MADLKDRIQADLKAAMLSGDKTRVSALNMLKGAILNQEIADGTRDTGLTDEQVIVVLTKEAKRRIDAAEMYQKAGREEQAAAELFEKTVIETYLPAQMSDTELSDTVDTIIAQVKPEGLKDMGKVIGAVKAKVGNTADGGRIASFVKEKLS